MYHACMAFYTLMIPLTILLFLSSPNSTLYHSHPALLLFLLQIAANTFIHMACRATAVLPVLEDER
jgi:hypothetical protein